MHPTTTAGVEVDTPAPQHSNSPPDPPPPPCRLVYVAHRALVVALPPSLLGSLPHTPKPEDAPLPLQQLVRLWQQLVRL